MQIISNVALISINETLIFQVISFLIFLFIINRIMFRPLRKVMNERETYIEDVQKDIVVAENQFEDLTHQIQAQENTVRDEAFKQKEQLEASGSQQASEIMTSTREEINALRAEAQKEVNAQISAARKHVQRESEDLAKDIIETVLYRRQQS
ncbi:MAG: ATP synthase F0 subunit B [Deltaproteobacteria bacterium]|jgi:F-type H+-transporting ATPase subunit b|nr:ATP synthase F0 subunit B [Deltaproteobacteria bacterium]